MSEVLAGKLCAFVDIVLASVAGPAGEAVTEKLVAGIIAFTAVVAAVSLTEIFGDTASVFEGFESLGAVDAAVSSVAFVAVAKPVSEKTLVAVAVVPACRTGLTFRAEMIGGALADNIFAGPAFFDLTGGRTSVPRAGISIVASLTSQKEAVTTLARVRGLGAAVGKRSDQ